MRNSEPPTNDKSNASNPVLECLALTNRYHSSVGEPSAHSPKDYIQQCQPSLVCGFLFRFS